MTTFSRTLPRDVVRVIHARRALRRGETVITHLSVMGMTHVVPR